MWTKGRHQAQPYLVLAISLVCTAVAAVYASPYVSQQIAFIILLIGASVSLILFSAARSEAFAHKRLEETLRDKEVRLQIALSAARMASWHWDLITGSLTWDGSPYTWPDFVQRVHPEDQAAIRTAVDEALHEH